MTIKQAIEKAIEGGWERPAPCEIEGIEVYHKGDTLLDPLFWQSLGKAMGWPEWCCMYCGGVGVAPGTIVTDVDFCSKCHAPTPEEQDGGEKMWLFKWHRFIDHLAEGKDAESYFQSL